MEVERSDPDQATTAERGESGWPERTRRLIGEVRSLFRTWLREPMRISLADFDRRLHESSQNTRDHVEQQRYLATRQRLVQERQAFETRFIASLDETFAQIGSESTDQPQGSRRQTLSLLDPLEHDLTAAMDQLVARSEARCGPLLVEISYRLAVLVGAPPLPAETVPLGPQAMAKAFRHASATLGLPAEHDLVLLHSLESTLIQGLGPLYERINRYLQAEGILPDLRAFPLPRGSARAARPAADAPAAASTSRSSHESGQSEPVNRAAGTTPFDPGNRLQQLRGRLRDNVLARDQGLEATSEQVQAALTILQARLTGIDGSGNPMLYTGGKLRDETLAQLHAAQPRKATPLDLGAEHRDIIELVALLFAHIDAGLPPGNAAHGLLARAQLPWLRMAVASPDALFNQPEHPAQQLLEAMLTTARDWVDDEASEAARHLRGQLEQLVEQLDREPPMAAVHARLLDGLQQQLAQLKRKAQVAEKRHIEAMLGRERLEQARSRAAELMAERFARTAPKGLLRALLDRAWSDVLALTLLRQGEQSDAFASRLVVTDQLLGLLPLGNRQRLQDEVETGLAQIGMQGEEAVHVAQRLLGAAQGATGEVPSATDLAMRLKQRQRLGDAQNAEAAPAVAAAAVSPEEARVHQQLLRTPPGRWFEFSGANGRTLQRKLAWLSTVSGRCLFVTRHGQRGEEQTLPQLARLVAAGQVREMSVQGKPLIEQAWQALARDLRDPAATREQPR